MNFLSEPLLAEVVSVLTKIYKDNETPRAGRTLNPCWLVNFGIKERLTQKQSKIK